MNPSNRAPSGSPIEEDPSPSGANIRRIFEAERRSFNQSSLGERVGLSITNRVGTMRFVAIHLVVVVGWVAWNLFAPGKLRFDPYPHGLMTFIVSLEGVLIATFVLIAQNRLSRQTDERDHLNLQIDLLAEQEMTVALKLLRRISERLGLREEEGEGRWTERLTEETDVDQLAETVKEELTGRDRE